MLPLPELMFTEVAVKFEKLTCHQHLSEPQVCSSKVTKPHLRNNYCSSIGWASNNRHLSYNAKISFQTIGCLFAWPLVYRDAWCKMFVVLGYSWLLWQSCKNIERHTADTIVSWPNPRQWVIFHTSDLMMIIRRSIYILSIITREMGKMKTYSPTYCIMDNG